MDKTLLRPMFRKRYLEEVKEVKPYKEGGIVQNVKKFQTGGFLDNLSNTEKAMYAATLAAPLLKGTRRTGNVVSDTLFDIGSGLEKLPATMLAVAKAKPKGGKSIRQATPAEKANLGFSIDDNVNVTVENGNVTGIASKPTAGERDKAADRSAAFKSLDRIEQGLKSVSTGPISGRISKAQAYLGFNQEAADLQVEIEDFRKSIIKALRGAQVGVAEEASFNAVLPSITDPTSVINSKVKIARKKLQAIESRLQPNGTVATQLAVEDVIKNDQGLYEILGIEYVGTDQNQYDPNAPTFSITGEVVK